MLSNDRSESLLDYLLFNPLDLMGTAFGQPPPTSIHAVSFLDRTDRILDEVRQIASKKADAWVPKLIWEPYYVRAFSDDSS